MDYINALVLMCYGIYDFNLSSEHFYLAFIEGASSIRSLKQSDIKM